MPPVMEQVLVWPGHRSSCAHPSLIPHYLAPIMQRASLVFQCVRADQSVWCSQFWLLNRTCEYTSRPTELLNRPVLVCSRLISVACLGTQTTWHLPFRRRELPKTRCAEFVKKRESSALIPPLVLPPPNTRGHSYSRSYYSAKSSLALFVYKCINTTCLRHTNCKQAYKWEFGLNSRMFCTVLVIVSVSLQHRLALTWQ